MMFSTADCKSRFFSASISNIYFVYCHFLYHYSSHFDIFLPHNVSFNIQQMNVKRKALNLICLMLIYQKLNSTHRLYFICGTIAIKRDNTIFICSYPIASLFFITWQGMRIDYFRYYINKQWLKRTLNDMIEATLKYCVNTCLILLMAPSMLP